MRLAEKYYTDGTNFPKAVKNLIGSNLTWRLKMRENKDSVDNNESEKKPSDDTGLSARDAAYKKVRSSGGSHREAVRSYCAGNTWLTENAKNTGNW